MFGKRFISKETKDWGKDLDEDGFIEFTPKNQSKDDNELGIPVAYKEEKKPAITVRDRLEKLSGNSTPTRNDDIVSVRDRLEELKKRTDPVPKPLDSKYFPEKQKLEEKKPLTPESLMQGKLEKAMSRVEELRRKMHTSPNSYLSLFYDLKQAEKGFLDLLSESETKRVAFAGPFLLRLEKAKSQIRNVKI